MRKIADPELIEQIIILRKKGHLYKDIQRILGCGKKIVQDVCIKNGLGSGNQSLKGLDKDEVNEYYKTHTLKETALFFRAKEYSIKRLLRRKVDKPAGVDRKKQSVISVSRRRRKIKRMAVEYKGGECELCGYRKCFDALEFHHKDPNSKDFSISGSGSCRAWERIRAELDECQLLCANCHREAHYMLRNSRGINSAEESLKNSHSENCDEVSEVGSSILPLPS